MANRKALIPIVVVAMVGTAGLAVASLSAGVQIGEGIKDGIGKDIARAFKGIRSVEKSTQVTKTLDGKALTELLVKGDALGDVTVRPGTGDVIRVVATVHGYGADEAEAKEMLATLDLKLDKGTGSQAVLNAERPSQSSIVVNGAQFGHAVSADVVVEVPARYRLQVEGDEGDVKVSGLASAQIETDNGAIEVQDLNGDLSATTDNGSITVSRIKGLATLKSDNGKIHARTIGDRLIAATDNGAIDVDDVAMMAELTSDNGRINAVRIGGELVAKSGNGSITAEQVRGGGQLRTDNGRITATGIAGPRVTAQTETGSINLDQPAITNADYELTTEHGRIEVAVSPKASLDVNLTSEHGSLESKLPLTSRIERDNDGERTISGVLNKGGHQLKATSETGSITVTGLPS